MKDKGEKKRPSMSLLLQITANVTNIVFIDIKIERYMHC